MKFRAVPIAVVAAAFAVAVPAEAACPINATVASFDIWGGNAMPAGGNVIGMHRCGRRIWCPSGADRRGARRRCRWL